MGAVKPFVNLGPGDAIRTEMEHYEWTQATLAEALGVSEKHVSELLNNKVQMTYEMAILLSHAFKQSPEFWLNLDRQYRQRQQARATGTDVVEQRMRVMRFLPVSSLRKAGILPRNPTQLVPGVVQLFNGTMPEFEAWEQNAAACFRRSSKPEISMLASVAWIETAKALLGKRPQLQTAYQADALIKIAQDLGMLSRLDNGPEMFVARLKEAGVDFLYLPHFEKTFIDGASLWLDEKNRPVIVYTARFDRNDHFWFTMAHEIGHLLLHRDKANQPFVDAKLLEARESGTSLEAQADDFAKSYLRMEEIIRFFDNGQRVSHAKVERCAAILNLHEGIVVGCLQHEGRLSYKNLNKCKVPGLRVALAQFGGLPMTA